MFMNTFFQISNFRYIYIFKHIKHITHKMVSITLSVSKELKEEMEAFPEINWSEVARDAIKKKIVLLEKFKQFSKESEINEDETITLGRELNKKLAKKYLK